MNRVRQAYFWPIVIVLACWLTFVGWRVAMGPELYEISNIEDAQ